MKTPWVANYALNASATCIESVTGLKLRGIDHLHNEDYAISGQVTGGGNVTEFAIWKYWDPKEPGFHDKDTPVKFSVWCTAEVFKYLDKQVRTFKRERSVLTCKKYPGVRKTIEDTISRRVKEVVALMQKASASAPATISVTAAIKQKSKKEACIEIQCTVKRQE